MRPFRDYRQTIQANRKCCPAGQCATWRNQPAQLRHQFAETVSRSWSPAEIAVLHTAAYPELDACDSCGPPTRAAYRIERVGELCLCGGCASQHWRALSAQGWTFWPMDVQALAPQASAPPGPVRD